MDGEGKERVGGEDDGGKDKERSRDTLTRDGVLSLHGKSRSSVGGWRC